MLLTFTIFAYSTKAEIFEYEISCFRIETLFILIISLQVSTQVLVLPFIQYSFPIPGTNNTVPLVRYWTGWIHKSGCLNELQEGRNWRVPLRVGLTPPPVRLATALLAWALKTPDMQSTQLHQTTYSWSASPCWGILFLMCYFKHSAYNLPLAVSSDMTENNLTLFVALQHLCHILSGSCRLLFPSLYCFLLPTMPRRLTDNFEDFGCYLS